MSTNRDMTENENPTVFNENTFLSFVLKEFLQLNRNEFPTCQEVFYNKNTGKFALKRTSKALKKLQKQNKQVTDQKNPLRK